LRNKSSVSNPWFKKRRVIGEKVDRFGINLKVQSGRGSKKSMEKDIQLNIIIRNTLMESVLYFSPYCDKMITPCQG
jgi:hypothetical protein